MNGIIFGTRCHDDLPRSYAISQMSLTSFFQRKRKSLKPQIGKRPMIMVAPDKFKGTLTAGEVTALISDALVEAFPGAGILRCPMADGGEGTAEIIARNLGLSPATTTGHDAMMHDIEIGFFKNGDTCAVDAAAIVGLAMLAPLPLRPWEASTYGLGEFILEMLRQGFKRIIICIGGTATVDAGAGMLQALGARFLDVEGNQISVRPITAANLSSIYSIDFSGIDRNPIKEAVTALADVDVPLLPSCEGEMSALDFAPQKGFRSKSCLCCEPRWKISVTLSTTHYTHPPSNHPSKAQEADWDMPCTESCDAGASKVPTISSTATIFSMPLPPTLTKQHMTHLSQPAHLRIA